MSNIPSSPKVEQIIWFEQHLPLWAATPTAFGATAAMITSLGTAVAQARKAYNDAQASKLATKAAITNQDEMIAAMLTPGRDLVNLMKGYIANANNPALWGQAGIEPNSGPGAPLVPTAPYELSASLNSAGEVILRWKATQPQGVSGVIYTVSRSVDNGPDTIQDSVGEKEYVDSNVIYGTQTVSYVVRSKRGKQTSDWSPALLLRFGRAAGGGMSIISTDSQAVKMAA